jgi:hypothetical protein
MAAELALNRANITLATLVDLERWRQRTGGLANVRARFGAEYERTGSEERIRADCRGGEKRDDW